MPSPLRFGRRDLNNGKNTVEQIVKNLSMRSPNTIFGTAAGFAVN